MNPKRQKHAAYSKYHAIKTVVDGTIFASKKEAGRYKDLRLLEKAGEILGLSIQPKYALRVNGETIGYYVADFHYHMGTREVVEDCKGFKNPLYRWKKKHFEVQYQTEILET